MWRTSNTNIGMQFPTVDECCCCELKTGVLLIGALHVVRVFFEEITNVARTCSLTHSVLFFQTGFLIGSIGTLLVIAGAGYGEIYLC